MMLCYYIKMSYRKRTRNLYDPDSTEPFAISRSRIDRFLECPRCFYLDRRLGFDRPGMPGFSLNNAVDVLLKKEFDILREKGHSHDLMKQYGIELIPFKHNDLPIWRDDIYRYVGASVIHEPTNLQIQGIVDDIWVDNNGVIYIVDYKSTSTKEEISLEDEYKQAYKKQVEVYQWIFTRMGFAVSDTAYFVFANASKEPEKFNGRLEFELSIIPHEGDNSWVEPVIYKIKECLESGVIPDINPECEYCGYSISVNSAS